MVGFSALPVQGLRDPEILERMNKSVSAYKTQAELQKTPEQRLRDHQRDRLQTAINTINEKIDYTSLFFGGPKQSDPANSQNYDTYMKLMVAIHQPDPVHIEHSLRDSFGHGGPGSRRYLGELLRYINS